MLEFKEPEIADKAWVDPLLKISDYMGCAYSFGNLYTWRASFTTRIARHGDVLFVKNNDAHNQFAFPAGRVENLSECIELMQQNAAKHSVPLVIRGVTAEQKALLEAAVPNSFTYASDRDWFDYVYNTSDLINLAGKKYHGKRNHIAKFNREFPNWSYEALSQENLDDCRAMLKEWYAQASPEDKGLQSEEAAINDALESYEALDFKGAIIRVDGKPVAFTMGERLNSNTFCIHFEKALSAFPGSYPMINREFCEHELAEYQYVNREEDIGIEGLRKAKLSYYPAILLEKFRAVDVNA
ncbi:MAG: phosphatidylglycerol lysyltransferase domain-containing protein [Oscillospiraceae bacterium]|jgi:hypothetical protein|nr:phosphatidylglycerol lysyltransferase domain-containing protein [Oscillospiraceae bacterium]